MQDALKNIREGIENYLSIVRFQTLNGILNKNDSCSIVERLYQIKNELEHTSNIDVNSLEDQLDKMRCEIYHKINSNPLKVRLLYLYAIHVWLFLILGILIDLALLLYGYLTNLIVGGVTADVVLWGFLGGCAYSMFYLRKNVYSLQFSKYYAIYYITYPFVGAAFGFGIAILFSAGLVSLQAKPSYALYSGISFISGALQAWVMSLIQTIAQAIHKTT